MASIQLWGWWVTDSLLSVWPTGDEQVSHTRSSATSRHPCLPPAWSKPHFLTHARWRIPGSSLHSGFIHPIMLTSQQPERASENVRRITAQLCSAPPVASVFPRVKSKVLQWLAQAHVVPQIHTAHLSHVSPPSPSFSPAILLHVKTVRQSGKLSH